MDNSGSSSIRESADDYRAESSSDAETCDSTGYAFPNSLSDSSSEADQGTYSIDESETSLGRYPARSRNAPVRYSPSSNLASHEANSIITLPITTTDSPTISEAMNASKLEREMWEEAIHLELQSLEEMVTWSIVSHEDTKRSDNGKSRILATHVLLKIKRNEDEIPYRFKARVVAGGNLQVIGEDCGSVYAPGIDYSVILLLLTIGHHLGWASPHVDIKSEFLNGYIDRETFVSHPKNLPPKMKNGNYYKRKK